MKKALFILALGLIFKTSVTAGPRWHPPMSPSNQTYILPLALGWLAAEIYIGGGVVVTVGEAAFVGVGIAGIVYYGTTPPPDIHIDWNRPWGDETLTSMPEPDFGPKQTPPDPDFGKGLRQIAVRIVIGKATAYFLLNERVDITPEIIKAHLSDYYTENADFRLLMDGLEIQRTTSPKGFWGPIIAANGKVQQRWFRPFKAFQRVGYDVYDPNTGSWSQTFYEGGRWQTGPSAISLLSPEFIASILPDNLPESAGWQRGVRVAKLAFERIKDGVGTPSDYLLVDQFKKGDCKGDTNGCGSLKAEMETWERGDAEFLADLYANPEMIQEFWALMKALDIFKRMPAGEEKEKLRDFLCLRFPKLFICEGREYQSDLDYVLTLLEETPDNISPDLLPKMQQIQAAFQVAEEEYNNDGDEDKFIERLLALDEEATVLLDQNERDQTRVTRLRNPSQNPEEEMIAIATKLLDLDSETKFLEKEFHQGRLTRYHYFRKLSDKVKEIEKWSKKLRDLIKDNYILPDDIWERATNRAFKADWVSRLLHDINGAREFGKLKISLKIYYRTNKECYDIMIDAGVRNNEWRPPATGN